MRVTQPKSDLYIVQSTDAVYGAIPVHEGTFTVWDVEGNLLGFWSSIRRQVIKAIYAYHSENARLKRKAVFN